ncbi:MAG: cytochrome c family protein [Deltaproteobacteria bacterium]|nr:cytochrome c family protein [Deltaproteobacteria bacterium]
MKKLILLWSLVLAAGLAGVALAQDDVMTLALKPAGADQRPPVVFTHAAHAEFVDCQTCHHDFDQYMNNKNGDGGNCADCHGPKPTAQNPVTLTQAYHQNCKTCHQRLLAQGKKTGPVTCGDCHRRGQPAPPAPAAPPAEPAK